jgi:hypothetical protein
MGLARDLRGCRLVSLLRDQEPIKTTVMEAVVMAQTPVMEELGTRGCCSDCRYFRCQLQLV